MSQIYTRRNLLISLLLLLALFSFFILYSYQNIRKALKETQLMNVTLQSLRTMEAVMDEMQEIETGMRGYVISGNKEFLVSYQDAATKLQKDTQNIKVLFPLYPERVPKLQALLTLVNHKCRLAEEAIKRVEQHGTDTVTATGRDKALMDGIRSIIYQYEAEDRIILNRSNIERQAAARSAARVFVGLALVFVVGLFIIFWRMRRGLQQRERYEQRIAYLAGLTEKTHDAIFSTDLQRVVKSWNQGAVAMYGYTPEEAIGSTVTSLLHIVSAKKDIQQAKADLDQLGYYKGEYEAIKKSGEPIYIYASISVLRNEKNEMEGYVAVHQDISERKKTEQFLKIFNEKLSLQVEEKTVLTDRILERISDGFYSLDENWNFTYMNKTAAIIMECDPQEIVGKNLWQEYPAAAELSIYQAYIRAFEDQQYTQVEFYYPPYVKWFMVDIYPSHSGISTFFRDITERKKAEEELKHSNERFEMISRTTNDAVWEWDLETGVMWANDTHQQLYGLNPDDPVPLEHVWQQRIHPDDRERLIRKQREAMAGNTNVFITEYRFNTVKDGYRHVYDRCYIVRNAAGKATRILGSMMDITDLKKTEEALQQSEEKYRSIIDQASDGIFMLDQQGNYVEANAAGLVMTGYSREELLRMNASQLLAKGELSVIQTSLDDLKAGKSFMMERRIIRKDQSERDVEVSYKMLSNGYILAIKRDITERKKTEQALMTSEETRRLIMNSALDAIVGMDTAGNITIWTPQAEKIFGWKEEEVTGKKMSSIVIPQRLRQAHEEGLARYLRSGIGPVLNRLIEIVALHRSGKEFPVELSILPVKQGSHQFFCAFIRDITERKKAEKAVAESEEKYRTLVEQAVDAIALYDANGKILDVNTGSVSLLGFSKEELMKMSLPDILTPEEINHRPVRYDILEQGNSTVKYRKMKRKDGAIIDTEVRSQQLPDGRFLSVIRDLTERIKAEKELAASYDAIRKLSGHIQDIREEERTNMAREIHDELGQQLTVLKMDVSWLKRRMATAEEPVKQKLQDLISMLDETVKTVRRISSELRPSILDDLGLVAAMEWQLGEFGKRSDVATHFDYPNEELLLPDTVKTALFRILQESLTNVARHSGATKVSVKIELKDDQLILVIADNGKGFDKQKIADKKTLGILGMQERITMIGGDYEINTVPGKGTEVRVALSLNNIKPPTV
jgi:PAS domain S-box-containing protein